MNLDEYKQQPELDEKDTCERCGEKVYSSELEMIWINFKPTLCCEDCVNELNK
jgi:hypothetical protein